MRRLFLFLCVLISLNGFSQIHIASGLQGEIYNQFANDINNNTSEDLTILPSEGSLENFELLQSNQVQLAFMQYDVLLSKGIERDSVRNQYKIFLPLYEEEIHLITRNDGKIQQFADLEDKRVGVGNVKSGTQITSMLISLKTGIEWQNVNISFDESFNALLNDRIDAFFFVGAAPSNKLKNLGSDVNSIIKLVPIEHEKLEGIYIPKKIDKEVYAWLHKDVQTYAIKSLLVVNTKGLSLEQESRIDSLYEDLKSNLQGIQKNKFSHPKWKQVNFTDMNGLDWPVFKQRYVTRELIIDIMAILAAILSFIQIYFIVNKLWKRKHERVVAESISISAMFISILINGFFAVKNLGTGQIPQLSANVMWIASSVISTMIGVGFWVLGNKQKGFTRLLLAALNLERKEAGDLAKAFFRPSGADEIIDILGQLAMIDDDLDKREREFIQTFADNWGIEMDWEQVEREYGHTRANPFDVLRAKLKDYLENGATKRAGKSACRRGKFTG